ncbi:MAG: sensor domain-containing diguanylate cyclase [Synergistaceae bacterium]|nr:sensor domain-containing diguanylate cyclase [Synergistaceae bacterium]
MDDTEKYALTDIDCCEIMRTVLDNIQSVIYVSDFQTHEILFANKYLLESLGDNGAGIEGKICWQTLQKDQNGPCPFCPNSRLMDKNGLPQEGLTCTWEHRNTRTKQWVLATDSAIKWIDGRCVHMEVARDISDLKEKEKELRQKTHELKQKAQELKVAASMDPLTGIYNRQMGGILLEEAWKRAQRARKKSTLCFLDLDALKEINDTFGHGRGDRALVDFVNIMKKIIRSVDILCRWGGDEFVLLLEGCTMQDSESLTLRRIQRHVEAFNEDPERKAENYRIAFSYGLQEIGGSASLDQTIALADEKMYSQKADKKRSRQSLKHS